MKKTQKKFLAIILLIIMFLNTMLPIAQALEYTTEDFQLVTKEEVNRENEFAIFGLQYEAYDNKDNAYINNPSSATPKKSYVAGDIVKVTLTLEETDGWVGMSSFQGFISYDSNLLEPISTILTTEFEKFQHPNFKVPEGYVDAGCSFEEKKVYVNSQTSDTATLTEGTIVEMYFVAKVDSRTKASVIVHSIEAYGYGSQVVYSWEDVPTANTPTLAIPEEGTELSKITHGIEITKTDVAGQPIKESYAVYRITPTDAENGELLMTNSNQVKDGKGLLSGLTMPLLLGDGASSTGENTIEYTIEEIQAPEGYQLDSQIKTLQLTFDEIGKVTGATLDTVELDASYIDDTNNIVKLSFTNEEKVVQGNNRVTFEITKLGENDQPITESSAVFGLTVAEGDVKSVITSSGMGRISVDVPEDISQNKVYTLNELTAPTGYKLIKQNININVEFEKNGNDTVVKSVSIGESDPTILNSVTVSKAENDETVIKVQVKNEKEIVQEKFQIEITKVNEKGSPITTGVATFSVTTPSGSTYLGQTTTEDGKVTIVGNIPTGTLDAEGYTYEIREVKAPNGYIINENPISVKLVFAEVNGARVITLAQVDGVDKTSSLDGNTLPISVVNKREVGNFTITLNKVDSNSEENIKGTESYFELTAPNGEKTSLSVNAEGTATYTGKMPETEGPVEYKLLEIVAPKGYTRNTEEQTITLNFGKDIEGVMQLVEGTVTDPIIKVSDTNNNLVIKFKNEVEVPVEKVTEFDLNVTKIDSKTGETITTSSTIFQLLDEFNRDLGLFETKTGIATIKLALPEEAGIVKYKLVEKVAPTGYVLDGTEEIISIEFAEHSGQMQIIGINITDTETVDTKLRDATFTATTANVSFINVAKPAIVEQKTFELIINKKDTNDTSKNIKEENVIFIVTGPDGVAQTLRTDMTGKISLTEYMPKTAGTLRYELQEIHAPSDYVAYPTSQYVDIAFEEIGGIMQIVNANTSVTGEKIVKDFAGVSSTENNQVIVSVLNDKYVEETSEKFTIKINKVDEALKNIEQDNVYFKVETAGEEPKLISTDTGGLAVFTANMPKEAKTVTYTLTELTGPSGYIKNKNAMILNLLFTEENGKITLTNIIINEAQGVRKVEDETNPINTVEIKVINKAEESTEGTFTVEINKQNNNVNIEQAGVSFELKDDNGNVNSLVTNENGIAIFTGRMPASKGNVIYTLKELIAPTGYIKNPNEMTITLTFDDTEGEMALTNIAVTEGEGIKVLEEITNNTAKVAVENEVDPNTVEKEKETFTLKINKRIKGTTNNILQADVGFEVKRPNGTSAYVRTDSLGVATFTDYIPEEIGNIVYTIKEVEGPEGYIKNPNELIVTFNFTQNDSDEIELGGFEVAEAGIKDTELGIKKISNVNKNTAEVAIDNEKIPDIIPDPRYGITLNKVNEAKQNIAEEGVSFVIIGVNGTAHSVETNKEGIITFSEVMPKIAGTYPIKIIELTAPTGYKKIEKEMTINLTFRETAGELKLINISIDNSDKAFIEKVAMPQNNQAELRVINEKETQNFTLKIHKQNKATKTNILESKAVFEVIAPDGKSELLTTDEASVATFIGKIPALEDSVEYTLKEVSAPEGYIKNLNDMTLTLSFGDINGKKSLTDVTVVEAEGIRKIADVSENIAEVAVDNEKKTDDTETKEKYGIRINKVKEDGENILEAGVSFELIDASGNKNYLATNANGVAVFTGVMPDVAGNITYTLEELIAPEGYVKNPNKMTITLTFDDSSGKMALTDVTVGDSQGITKDSGIENNIAEVKVINKVAEPEEIQKFTLEIHKQDKDTKRNILQEGVVFEITAPDGKVLYAKTNREGIATFEGAISSSAGNRVYKINEINAPEGYIKNENEMNVTVSFTENSEVISLNDIIVDSLEGVRKLEILPDNTAKIAVDNEKKPDAVVEEKYLLKINNVDEALNNILQEGILFKVIDISGEVSYVETDRTGVAIFTGTMPKQANTYNIKLYEMSGPNGYVKNPNEMIISAKFENIDEEIKLTDITVNEEEQIRKVETQQENTEEIQLFAETQEDTEEIQLFAETQEDTEEAENIATIKNNTAEVQVINTKEVLKDQFILGIEKVDAETLEAIEQERIIFKVEDSMGNYNFYATDNEGRTQCKFEMPETAGTYTYYISEIVAPTGYLLNTNKIPVQATFIDTDGKITLQKYTVDAEGIARVVENVTDGHIGFVQVLNEIIKEEITNTFTIELNKVDSVSLENIKQSGVIFKIKEQNGKSSYLETDENGKITLTKDMPNEDKTVRYEIEEIRQPNGYKLLTELQYVDITFSKTKGKMQIANAVFTGNKMKGTYGTEKVIISILNDAEETKVDPEKPTFDLIINKVDAETLKNIEKAGVKFKVTSPENTVANVETTNLGEAILKLNVPETEGKYRYKLLEILAPTGYDKNEKELYVDITFSLNNEKLEITDISVNTENGITAVGFQEASCEVKVENSKTKEKPNEKPDDEDKEKPVFDIETDKYITTITMKYSDTNEIIKRTVQNKDGISKLDVKADRLKYLSLDIEYKIVAKNVGNKEGTLSSILDRIPNGLYLDSAKNKYWEVVNNIAINTNSNGVLKPGESKEATIVLSYSGKTLNTGELINYATFEAVEEKDMEKPTNTNNIDNATLILSIKTGQEWVVYPVLTIISLAIMAIGVIGIKKYVL